jgi:hypothetical protein
MAKKRRVRGTADRMLRQDDMTNFCSPEPEVVEPVKPQGTACPYCKGLKSSVRTTWSARLKTDRTKTITRRSRLCTGCARLFTTTETVED